MQRFKVNYDMLAAAQAMDADTQPARRPARRQAYAIENDVVHVTTEQFATEFPKIIKFCRDRNLGEVRISDPFRPEFHIGFKLNEPYERDTPVVSLQSLREQGVAVALGNQDRVALGGAQRKIHGYLIRETALPPELTSHVAASAAVDPQGLHRVVTPGGKPLEAGEIMVHTMASSYLLYERLREIPASDQSLTACHMIGDRPTPSFKIWRPDAGIETQGSVSLKTLETSFFTGAPKLLKLYFGPGLNNTLTAIITDDKYHLPPETPVVAAPLINPLLERRIAFSMLASTHNVEQRVGMLTGLQDHWKVQVDQRPAAELYGPRAPVATVRDATWAQVVAKARFESLQALFAEAGGPVLIVPDWHETFRPGRLAILTPPSAGDGPA